MKTKQYRSERYSDHIELPVPPVPVPPVPTLVDRKNQADMTTDEQERFKSAVTGLIGNGFFSFHVGHHANMSHRMHGSMAGAIGFQRFLPWHRAYLSRLEEQLRLVDDQVFIPYWKWSVNQQFPGWLASFLPTGVTRLDGSPIAVTRNPGAAGRQLPNETAVNEVMQRSTFNEFTPRLEGIHNTVHGWVGGTMNNIRFSPADPVFWLHHTEVDRLWHKWQQTHPGEHPTLSGPDAVLDPWPETEADVRRIEDLAYRYA